MMYMLVLLISLFLCVTFERGFHFSKDRMCYEFVNLVTPSQKEKQTIDLTWMFSWKILK